MVPYEPGDVLALSASLRVIYTKTLQGWLTAIEVDLQDLIKTNDSSSEIAINAASRFLKLRERVKLDDLSLKQKFKEALAVAWWLREPECSMQHYLGFVETEYHRKDYGPTEDKNFMNKVCCLVFLHPSVAELANLIGKVVIVTGAEIDRLKPLCRQKSAIVMTRKGKRGVAARIVPRGVEINHHKLYRVKIFDDDKDKVTINDFPSEWQKNPSKTSEDSN